MRSTKIGDVHENLVRTNHQENNKIRANSGQQLKIEPNRKRGRIYSPVKTALLDSGLRRKAH